MASKKPKYDEDNIVRKTRPEGPPREYVCVTVTEYNDDVECFATLRELITNQIHDLVHESSVTLDECDEQVAANPDRAVKQIKRWFEDHADDSPSPTMTVYHPELGQLEMNTIADYLKAELAGKPAVTQPPDPLLIAAGQVVNSYESSALAGAVEALSAAVRSRRER
jgi:hypothetical protein